MSDLSRIQEGQKHVSKAWKILRSPGGDPEELRRLANGLKEHSRFGLARRILERAREDPEDKIDSRKLSQKLRQQHAVCTYKDRDLPRHLALKRAWKILDHQGDLEYTKNQETLGIAGAIYKRKWEVDARKSSLERSLAYYYERGHKAAAELRQRALAGEELTDPRSEIGLDQVYEGYTSINAAFVLDLLASIEEAEARGAGSESSIAKERRKLAKEVREELAATLPECTKRLGDYGWWGLASLGEAQFGLGLYEEASATLEQAKRKFKPDPWEFESTVKQLARLAQIQRQDLGGDQAKEESRAWETIRSLLGGDEEAVRSVFYGKLGLALSGGGFRASLFHIGLLARLAEQDLLRHVNVLSCVSGGSIVGAHYYLEVRKLLQENWDLAEEGRVPEEVLDRDKYIDLVDRLARDFASGVRRNLRTRVVGNLIANVKMILFRNYSRTDRLGELFESEIYSKVDDGGGKKRFLDELLIVPREFAPAEDGKEASKPQPHFQPKDDNWRRRNKVPMLVLNATSLNTGHNWQFTSTWMGESPFAIDEEIDGNWRLRRMWYSNAPEEYKPPGGGKRIRLGTAVGASACVPGMFEPVGLERLYPNEPISADESEFTVRLVDGGVHDNQGVTSLLEQDCEVIIVSDASGQMTSTPDPGSGVLSTLLRTNSVLMERVRQAQFQDLKARLRAGLLRGLMIVHLKKGLEVDPVDWKECEEPPDIKLRRRSELLRHGVLRKMQERLAGVRTDLDSFSEVEANALMTSGYLMAATYVEELNDFPRRAVAASDRHPWPFLAIEGPLYTRGKSRKIQERVERLLDVAGQGAFKIWSLSMPLKVLAWMLLAAAVAGLVWFLSGDPDLVLVQIRPPKGFAVTIGRLRWALGVAVAASLLNHVLGGVFGKVAIKALRWRETLWQLARGAAMSTVGVLVAGLHIHVFDRIFLRMGRLKSVLAGLHPAESGEKEPGESAE